MRIIIPIGGSGQRFKDDGYIKPKPLIPVLGTPMVYWVLDHLHPDFDDVFHMVINKELADCNFQNMVQNRYPKRRFEFTVLKTNTRGPAHTVLLGLEDVAHLNEPVMVMDCDTFYVDDVVGRYKAIGAKNVIFYAEDKNPNPIYSYIKLDGNRVESIAEKVKISDNANTGCYCFSSAKTLKQYCQSGMDSNDGRELYISALYATMLKDGQEVIGERVDDFVCLGTPLQVKVFASAQHGEPMRLCFDLDNTLVSYPLKPGDYTSVSPLTRNIGFVRFLKRMGHTIIIYTARRMKTHGGDVGKIMVDVGAITLATIKDFDIPCDELYFGKPYANYYIDDLSVNPYRDMEKDLGFYDCNIKPRSFNTVIFEGNLVRKVSGSLAGEAYFYNHIPPELGHLFPKLIYAHDGEIVMERVNGVSLSYLLITKALTPAHIDMVIDALSLMHNTPVDIEKKDATFYVDKMKQRYADYDYSGFPASRDVYVAIKQKLEEHVRDGDVRLGVVHGDPVMTNILMTPAQELKFIDMRGELAPGLFSIGGDIMYDYAKVYQSLLGYDFVLAGLDIDHRYLAGLREWFVGVVRERCDGAEECLQCLTNSLLFSLIPLHDNDKCRAYYDLIKT